MSKAPLTYSNENVLRCSSASNSQSFLRRSSKDTKATDLKSPVKSSMTTKSSFTSPVQYPSKKGYAWMHLKSPTDKIPNSVMASVDNFEAKENCSFESKLFSASKQDNKRSLITLNTDKSLTLILNKHGSSGQLKSPQMKSLVDPYETISSRKAKKVEAGSHVSLNLAQKEDKVLELSKKASLPTNLKLTLEKICTKGGSSTHRPHLNSPTSESSSKVLSGADVQKKSARGPGIDNKGRDSLGGSSSRSNSNAKCKLNTLLVGLTRPSVNQPKKSGKLSFRDTNSVSGTPRQNYNEVYSIEEKNEALKKYNKLLEILKEKNGEIKRLSQDKTELQSTLGSVVGELKTLRGPPGSSKEREVSFTDSKGDTSSSKLKPEGLKVQSPSSSFIQGVHLYTKKPSNVENKASKGLSTSFGTYKSVKGLSDRSGKSWMTAVHTKAGTGSESTKQKDALRETDDHYEAQQYMNKPSYKVYTPALAREPKEKKDREATSVDEGVLRRRASHDVDLDKRKRSLQEGLDIGGALSELKSRIERLLKSKSNSDGSKTKLLCQSLQEHLQKVV